MAESGISWKKGVSIVLLAGGIYLIMVDRPVMGILFVAAGFGFMTWD